MQIQAVIKLEYLSFTFNNPFCYIYFNKPCIRLQLKSILKYVYSRVILFGNVNAFEWVNNVHCELSIDSQTWNANQIVMAVSQKKL